MNLTMNSLCSSLLVGAALISSFLREFPLCMTGEEPLAGAATPPVISIDDEDI
jgi:hypothetical protein